MPAADFETLRIEIGLDFKIKCFNECTLTLGKALLSLRRPSIIGVRWVAAPWLYKLEFLINFVGLIVAGQLI